VTARATPGRAFDHAPRPAAHRLLCALLDDPCFC
jgi:hypothetical protein